LSVCGLCWYVVCFGVVRDVFAFGLVGVVGYLVLIC